MKWLSCDLCGSALARFFPHRVQYAKMSLTVKVKAAKELPNIEWIGNIDPFVKLTFAGMYGIIFLHTRVPVVPK